MMQIWAPHFSCKRLHDSWKIETDVFAWPKPAPLPNDRSGSALRRVSVPTFRWTFRRDLFNYCDPDESGNISMEEFQDVFWVKWVPYLEELCVFFHAKFLGKCLFPIFCTPSKRKIDIPTLHCKHLSRWFSTKKKSSATPNQKEANLRNFFFCQPKIPSKQDLPRRFSWETNKQSNQPPPTPLARRGCLGPSLHLATWDLWYRGNQRSFFTKQKTRGEFLGGRWRNGVVVINIQICMCFYIHACSFVFGFVFTYVYTVWIYIYLFFWGGRQGEIHLNHPKWRYWNSATPKKNTYSNLNFLSFIFRVMVMMLHQILTFLRGFNPHSTFIGVHTLPENVAMSFFFLHDVRLPCTWNLTRTRTLLWWSASRTLYDRGRIPHPTTSQELDESQWYCLWKKSCTSW